jgi:hypothetical protein
MRAVDLKRRKKEWGERGIKSVDIVYLLWRSGKG